jgi:Rieske Fe-S protein
MMAADAGFLATAMLAPGDDFAENGGSLSDRRSTHRAVAITSIGLGTPNDHRFQCTHHDSKYTPDGTYTSGRATRNMDRFPIRRDGATLHVDVTRVFHSDQDAAGWAAASVTA